MNSRRSGVHLWLTFAVSFSAIFAVAKAFPQNPATNDSSKVASPDYSGESFVIEDLSTDVTFLEDGTGQQELAARVRIQSQAGVQQFGVLNFPYKSENERLDIVYVRVTKASGAVTDTPATNAQDIPSEVSRVAPTYSDSREKQIPVRALGVGDVLEWRIRNVRIKPEAPGQFWYQRDFTQEGIVLQETLRVTVPLAKYVFVKASSPSISPQITEEKGQRIYFWKTSNLKRLELREGAPTQQLPKQLRSIQLTTFRNWDEVGHWYGALQKSQLELTPAIRAKAAELVSGATTDDAKLDAIYRYVATQFRYISVSFGQGRYQPHSADEVLSNQYGDCKDKHTLFAALLRAAGIKAWTVLIGAGIKLDPDVPSPAQFNHVITYIPHHDPPVWLDTTPEVAPYGMLQQVLRDEKALVIPDSGGTSVLMTTPEGLPFPADERVTVTSKLSSDGTLTGHFDLTSRGDSGLILKSVFHVTPPAKWTEMAQNISFALGYAGTISNLDVDNPADTSAHFHYSYDYDRKSYSDWENRRFTPPVPPIALPHSGDQEKPEEPVYLGAAGQSVYSAKMELPSGYSLEIPNDTNAQTDFAEYHAVYSVKDRVFTVERRLVLKGTKVTAAQWSAYQDFVKTINGDQGRFIQLVHGEAGSSDRIVQNNPEAAELVQKAIQSLQNRDFNTARDALAQAERLNPEQANLWAAYATLYGLENRKEETIGALKKEIQFHPGNEAMYRALARAQSFYRYTTDAIDTWRKLVKMAPNDADAVGQLASLLFGEKKFSEAEEPLQTALKGDPDNTKIGLQLAEALLHEGKTKDGLTLLAHVMHDVSNGSDMNTAGYMLADTGTDPPLAKFYSERAVADLEGQSKDLTLAGLTNDYLRLVDSLGAAWDTLGWAYFRAGDLVRAEKFVHAAWMLLEHPAAGDHLGQILEKQGKRDAAIHSYELAIAAQHNLPETRERLMKLRGGEVKAIQPKAGSRPNAVRPLPLAPEEELGRLRTTTIPELTQKHGSAEVFVLFSASKLLDVQFIRGDEQLKGSMDAISHLHFNNVSFPDEGPERIVRRGILSCSPYSTPSCSLVFLLPANTTK
jgi:transglutaminase-like putative cysteine protease/tetratricopeptide (TPR) repeat protein